MDANILLSSVDAVTSKWTKQRKQEERGRAQSRRSALVRTSYWTIKDAAWSVMKEAYLKASADGTLPTAARQLYYASRKQILELTGKHELDSGYFTQTILPEYVAAHGCKEWDIVYDARGHHQEPHTGLITPLGTLDVRQYLNDISNHENKPLDIDDFLDGKLSRFSTCGPHNRYSALLFIEKEGFLPLFQSVKLAERFDIAIMSTKGMPVIACRYLVDELCGQYGIPLLVLHDFDKSGFSIIGTLNGAEHWDKDFNERAARYEYKNEIEVIDLGLGLPDVQMYELESEPVRYRSDPSDNLEQNGATKEEIAFLCGDNGYRGQRVELNAFTSPDFIKWIESKLKQYDIKKKIPDAETLETAYRRAVQLSHIEEGLENLIDEAAAQTDDATVPKNLTQAIQKALKKDPAKSWDAVIADIAAENL